MITLYKRNLNWRTSDYFQKVILVGDCLRDTISGIPLGYLIGLLVGYIKRLHL